MISEKPTTTTMITMSLVGKLWLVRCPSPWLGELVGINDGGANTTSGLEDTAVTATPLRDASLAVAAAFVRAVVNLPDVTAEARELVTLE